MDFEELRVKRSAANTFSRNNGVEIEEIGLGYARSAVTVGPEHLNPVGVPHGGLYFTLADNASGSAMASHGYQAVTLNASYSFFRSAKVGDRVTAVARETKGGKTVCVFDVQVANQDGVVLGSGTFTYYRLDKKIEL